MFHAIAFRSVGEGARFLHIMIRPAPGVALVASILTAVAGTLRQVRRHDERILFPQPNVGLFSFDDRPSGGDSRVISLQRDPVGATWIFALGRGLSCWAGMGGNLEGNRSGTGVDLSGWTSIAFELETDKPLPLVFSLLAKDPRIWRKEDFLTLRHSESHRHMVRTGRIDLPLSEFALAAWWTDHGLVAETDTSRSLDRTLAFQISAFPSGEPGRIDTLKLRGVRLLADRPVVGNWVWAIPALSWCFATGLFAAGFGRGVGLQGGILPPGLEPVPLALGNLESEQRRRISAYLEANYQDTGLDADKICRETGIPRSRLPDIMRDMGTTYKALLNDLRLREASRLLRETDRSVSEIAFAVGYGSIPHFNRVFRGRFGHTPQIHRALPEPAETGSEERAEENEAQAKI